MDDLIEALTIFKKYMKGDALRWPTNCVHDYLCVGCGKDAPSEEDKKRLKELGWVWSYDYDSWSSHWFGSY